jgi:hypothetical protein
MGGRESTWRNPSIFEIQRAKKARLIRVTAALWIDFNRRDFRQKEKRLRTVGDWRMGKK